MEWPWQVRRRHWFSDGLITQTRTHSSTRVFRDRRPCSSRANKCAVFRAAAVCTVVLLGTALTHSHGSHRELLLSRPTWIHNKQEAAVVTSHINWIWYWFTRLPQAQNLDLLTHFYKFSGNIDVVTVFKCAEILGSSWGDLWRRLLKNVNLKPWTLWRIWLQLFNFFATFSLLKVNSIYFSDIPLITFKLCFILFIFL